MAVNELALVEDALLELRLRHPAWNPNYIKWIHLSEEAQEKWWRLAKLQADKGAPAMKTLVLKVIELRMKA